MNRRLALKQMCACLGTSTLFGPSIAWSQQGAGNVRIGGGKPAVKLAVPQAVVNLLWNWENHTKGIETLHGHFKRYIYNSTYQTEHRSEGTFWYQAPDHARLDFRTPESVPKVNTQKLGPNGQPYSVVGEKNSKWVCTGKALVVIDDDSKEYSVIDIPPRMQGENITNSPLPFLFGVTATRMQQRYTLSLGSMHNPDRKNPRLPMQAHVVAYPKLSSDAKEWSRAEVILDVSGTFRDSQGQALYVPTAIRLLDPTGNKETVYWFDLNQTKCNDSLLSGILRKTSPFDPGSLVRGFKLTEHQKFDPGQDAQPPREARDRQPFRPADSQPPSVIRN